MTGDVISFCGKNGSGKTTALDALKVILAGAKTVNLERPIKDGQTHSEIIAEIDGVKIVREYVGKPGGKYSTSVKAFDAGTGFEMPNPQSTIEKLLGRGGAYMLDPLAFSGLGPTAQVTAMQKLLDLNVDDLDDKAGALKEELKFAERALEELRAKNANNPSTEGAPESPVDVSALAAELSGIETAANNIGRGEEHLRIKRDLIEDLKGQIARLTADLETKEKEAAEYAERVEAERERAKGLRSAEDVRAELSTAQAHNDLYSLAVRLEGDRKAFREKEARRVQIENELDAIKSERKKRVAEKKMPVSGLEFGDGGLLYNGQPFSQASRGETIEVGTAIALAMADGQVKVVLIEDASLLDDEHLASVRRLAEAAGAQLILEMVRPSDGEGTVVVLDQGDVVETRQAVTA
jgi:recombinational DNA repair ATPase RecF